MISGYDLSCPTAAELEGSLAAIIGQPDSKVALRVALRDIGARTNEFADLPPERLLGLALALARQRGLPAVIGRSFAIRLSTYVELRTREEANHARD